MSEPYLVQVPADLKSLSIIRGFIEEAGAGLAVNPGAVADMVQAVDEAATNLIVHAYRGNNGVIEVDAERNGHWFVVHLRDQAAPFDPTKVPPPDVTTPLARRKIGGFGIHLMRQFTDKLLYRSDPERGNELTLIKNISS